MQGSFERGLADGNSNILHQDAALTNTSSAVFEHVQFRELQTLMRIEHWERSFKVAFVRNPWERMHSYWYFVWKRYLNRGLFSLAMDIAGRERCFFNEWLIHIGHHFRSGTISENANQLPQSAWLCDERGKMLADFIGCYEHLERDWRALQERLGVPLNLERLYQNQVDTGDRRDYRLDYSEEGIEWVKRHFAEDIERFGYVFDQAAPVEAAQFGVSENV